LKSGSLNLLEPSGPVQTCNGIALPFIRGTSLGYHLRVGNEQVRVFTGSLVRKINAKYDVMRLT
jgi:hypothetical protein